MFNRSLRTVGAFVIASLSLSAVTTAFANECSTSWCEINYTGHINIINDWWGVSGSGTSGSQSIWTGNTGYGYSWGSSYDWSAGNNQYQVKTYAAAFDGWNYNNNFGGSPFPMRLNSSSKANCSEKNTYASGGSYDVIYDSFFNYSATPGSSNPQAELEVYTTASFGFNSWKYTRTVDGITYHVAVTEASDWPIYAYCPANGYVSSQSINVMDIAKDASSLGMIGNTAYLLDVDYGIEVYYGSGTFTVGTYSAP
jgi:hypothetical protein